MRKGKLITLEGPDGAGKTTLLKRLVPQVEEAFEVEVVASREPGGVGISEAIRQIILDVQHTQMDAKTELLLYMAARRQHLVEKVLPALEDGKWVFLDRFIDSSVAYQGGGRGLDQEAIQWLNGFVIEEAKPDVTFLLDIDTETGLSRIISNRSREVNRLDLEAKTMHQKVRQTYLNLAKQDPERVHILDASRSPEQLEKEVLTTLEQMTW